MIGGAEEHFEALHLVHQAPARKSGGFYQMDENAVEDAAGDQEDAEAERSQLGEKEQAQDFAAQEWQGKNGAKKSLAIR